MDKEHPIEADCFLVMTFTNAAAAEMKERIGTELEERLEKDPDNLYLRKQIRKIRQADISTIHKMCIRDRSIVYGIKTVVLSLLNFAIMLSANLGVMNLLPLPALDGGRLVFIIIEMIRRKKVPPEKEGICLLYTSRCV